MMFDRFMSGLSIEVTRRCNMKCSFCSRGEAQNIDISNKLIDQTLNEVRNYYIGSVRFSGGEPLLVPESLEYLVDQIIKKQIAINNVTIYTNGSVLPQSLIGTMDKLLTYLEQVESRTQSICNWYQTWAISRYSLDRQKIVVIVSDIFHGEIDKGRVRDFFSQIKSDRFKLIFQSDGGIGIPKVIVEGKAKQNYIELFGKEDVQLGDLRIYNNNYNLLCNLNVTAQCDETGANYKMIEKQFRSPIGIDKIITISANGNAFPGCMMEYKRVDSSPMFNVMECNNNFFTHVEEFCWKNPITKKAADRRDELAVMDFCKEHGIKIIDKDDGYYSVLKLMVSITDEIYMPIFRKIHTKYPFYSFDCVELIATVLTVRRLRRHYNFAESYIEAYLKRSTYLEILISDEVCEDVLRSLGVYRKMIEAIKE